jgi:hypothetical protein
MHKLIMMSATYSQSSRADNERALMTDPGNRFLWRQNMRRLEAEALRDSVLSDFRRTEHQTVRARIFSAPRG